MSRARWTAPLASLLVAAAALVGPAVAPLAAEDRPGSPEAAAFLDFYEGILASLYPVTSENEWTAATDVTDEHTATAVGSNQVMSAFTGSPYVIQRTRELLDHRDRLSRLQALQLEKILLAAAVNPGTQPELVRRRIAAQGRASNLLDGFEFTLPDASGQPQKVNPNDLDEVLRTSTDLSRRLAAWESSKAVGPVLKPSLVELRELRNRLARELGYASFFSLQVADYRLPTPEMMAMMDQVLEDVRPLYQQLHCWTKNQLARRYGQPVPKRIPAHWLGNRWGQEWPGLVEGVDLGPLFAGLTPEQVVKHAESFYASMGFPQLPASFWEKSDLYDLPADAPRKKNRHASAWHVDLDDDVRSLMSVRSDAEWFSVAHHELGHIYYYVSYSRPEVPLVLREGANRAYHEAIGELAALATSQTSYLRELGLMPKGRKIDRVRWLLNDAFNSVVFLPFAAGVMARFEHDLYEKDLPPDQWNATWWDYVARYQGIEPPSPRGEDLCDACTKTHVIDDPAQYYDYALATVIKFQLHDHIAREILKEDPRDASYRGHEEVGEFLRRIMAPGASRDWREVLREATGEDLNGRAMLEYYAPLMEWLKRQNKGCDCTM